MREWLVRSSGEIKGPYDMDGLSAAILSQEIGLLDEVCQPMSRWTYVREHQELRALVEKVRQRIDQNLDRTQTNILGSLTQTVTMTQEGNVVAPEEKDVKDSRVKLPDGVIYSKPNRSDQEVKRFTTRNDLELARESKQTSIRWIQLMAASFFVIVGVFLAYRGWESKLEAENAEAHYHEMIRWAKLGMGNRAYEEYKKIKSQRQLSLNDAWLMAPWILRYELNTEFVQTTIQKMLEENPQNPEIVYRSYLGYANIALFKGDLQKAKRQLLQAQTIDPRAEVPRLNLALLSLRAKDPSFAFSTNPSDMEKLTVVSDLEALTWGLVQLHQGKKLDHKTHDEFRKLLDQKLTHPTFLKDRLILLRSLWNGEVDKTVWETPFVEEYEFKMDPYLFPDVVDPRIFDVPCDQATDQGTQILCSLLLNQLPDAQKRIQDWEMQESSSRDSVLARGHFLEKTHSWKELQVLSENPIFKDLEIVAYWKLLTCSKGIGTCQAEIEKWSAIESKSVETEIVLADALVKSGQRDRAKALYQRALNQLSERVDLQEKSLESP